MEIDRSDSFSNTCTTQPNISTSLTEHKLDRENRSSAPVLNNQSTSTSQVNQTSQCLSVRKYDPSLGINPPSMQKTLQQRSRRDLAKASAFRWLPDGPWSIDGKLDPQFLDWQAKEWMKAYGGDIHKKKADVLRHFKKDAANIAIAWSNYSEQQIDRYRNASTRMEFGIGIKEEEQQILLARHRAISEPLPEEMNPVWSGEKAEVLSLAGVEEVVDIGNDREMTGSEFIQTQSLASVDSRSIAPSPSLEAESPSHLPKNTAVDIPIDSDGLAENPDAYRLWQPKKMEEEKLSAEEWQERWAKLRERLSRSKT